MYTACSAVSKTLYELLRIVPLFKEKRIRGRRLSTQGKNTNTNSNNNVLLTLLVSNNFVELKGSVFKKCEKQNLFQISCAAAAAAQLGAQFAAQFSLSRRPFLPAAGAPTRSSASRCSSTS